MNKRVVWFIIGMIVLLMLIIASLMPPSPFAHGEKVPQPPVRWR